MKNIPYKEGDVFAVSLRLGGFSLGVIARAPNKGNILLGYFFQPIFATLPTANDVPELRPEDAVKIIRFGDLFLMSGDWPIVSHLADWKSDEWPMPKFVRHDPLSKKAWLGV